MEQVLYRTHVRVMNSSNRLLSPNIRRMIEMSTLLVAVFFLATNIILHLAYISNSSSMGSNCLLSSLEDIKKQSSLTDNYSVLENSVDRSIPELLQLQNFDIIALTILSEPIHWKFLQNNGFRKDDKYDPYCKTDKGIYSFETNAKALKSKIQNNPPGNTFLFSYQRGNLMLSQEPELYHKNFSVLELRFDTEDSCFGGLTNRWLAHLTKALDVVIVNWAIAAFGSTGYLYNSRTRVLFNLNFAADFVNKKGRKMVEMRRREGDRNGGWRQRFIVLIENSWRFTKARLLSPILTGIIEQLPLRKYLEMLAQFEFLSDFDPSMDPSVDVLSEKERNFFSIFTQQIGQFIAFRLGVVFSTSFLFFISTTLINYILRETQERMLRFTFLLNYYITHDMPHYFLITSHVIGSLVFVPIIVGIYFFMFEFFSDQLLAFLVLLVVWMGEVFSILCLRSIVTIRYFPSMFAAYFYMLHFYIFSYPFGFSYLALLATMLFVLHAMMHFWNVYEVPAFAEGRISPVRPRMRNCVGALEAFDVERDHRVISGRSGSAAVHSPLRESNESNSVSSRPTPPRAGTGRVRSTSVDTQQASQANDEATHFGTSRMRTYSNGIGTSSSGKIPKAQASIYESLSARRIRLDKNLEAKDLKVSPDTKSMILRDEGCLSLPMAFPNFNSSADKDKTSKYEEASDFYFEDSIISPNLTLSGQSLANRPRGYSANDTPLNSSHHAKFSIFGEINEE